MHTKNNMYKKIAALGLAVLLAGCSTHSENISAAYVSPVEYQGYSCNQLRQELMRVNRKILEVSGQQDSEATKDAVAFTVGMVVFWPALFFMIGEDKKGELARLKGEYEALETAAIQKECDVADEIATARKKRAEYLRKRRQEDSGGNEQPDSEL